MQGLEEELWKLQKKMKQDPKTDPLYVKIDGSTSGVGREKAVKTFQVPLNQYQKNSGKGGTRIILLSITAASTGLTLTASSTVIFAEMYWTPATLRQAEDRVHRIGQENSVNIIYLMGRGTIDERIFSKVQKKFHTVSNALDGVNA
jgi:SWI/SNF-related matrix-associated actin-dependent regulator 1 of chromatin subfamily A